jgi:hypothetical protein
MMDSRNVSAAGAVTRDSPTPEPTRRKRISMHEGIAVWCDCCSCAAEPYWLAVAEEMGIDLGSDYEDGDTESPPKA